MTKLDCCASIKTYSSKILYGLLSLKENKTEIAVRYLFRNLGYKVALYPLWFLIIPFIIAISLSTGIFFMHKSYEGLALYAPSNSKSFREAKFAEDFFEFENGVFILELRIFAKDGGSLLRSEKYIDNVLNLIDYLTNNATVEYQGTKYTFSDLRINDIETNTLLTSFLKSFTFAKFSNNSMLNSNFRYKFPVMDLGYLKMSLAEVISDVNCNDSNGEIESVKQVIVRFISAKGNLTHLKLLENWTLQFLYPEKIFFSEMLGFLAANEYLADAEAYLNTGSILMYSAVSFSMVTLFAAITSSDFNCITSKPIEACCGVATVGLASITGLGTVCYLGQPFHPILTSSAVIVLALGLDVTFIILRSWKCTDSTALGIPDHLAKTLEESGPSIVITTLTNIISAAIGAIGTTHILFLFCLTVSLSVTILFILQVTFFAAIVAIGARREKAGHNAIFIFWENGQLFKYWNNALISLKSYVLSGAD